MKRFKSRVAAVLLTACAMLAPAQQPQTQTAPIVSQNAKYVNGVAPGFWTAPATGLQVSVSGGTAFCSGAVAQYAAGTLSLTASTTNYIYLNTASSCAPTAKTTPFTTSDIPIAEVITTSTGIASITDLRSEFTYTPQSGGAGIPGTWSADTENTGGNGGGANGVANILANSAWQAQPSGNITEGPAYTGWDNAAWNTYAGQSSTTVMRSLLDLRNGQFTFFAVNPGSVASPQYQGISFNCEMGTNPAAPYAAGSALNNGNNCYSLSSTSDIPGFYQGFMSGAPSPENVSLQNFTAKFYTAGINHSLDGGTVDVSGAGDTQIHDWSFLNHYGGGDHWADEGFHVLRETVYPNGYGDFFGTIGAVTPNPTSGYTKVWLSSTAGSAGDMQTVFNTTQGVADSITAIGAGDGSGDVTLTMAGTSYSVSTPVTLAMDVNATVDSQYGKTLQAVTFNTTTDLSVSNPVTSNGPGIGFAAGNGSTECAAVKSYGPYNSTAHTQVVNIMLSDAHHNGDHAYIGGMACHGLTIDADNTTVKSLFYVFGSSANNKLLAGRMAGASIDGAFISTGPVHVYPTARIVDVRPDGPFTGDDNWLRLEETGNTWNVSDTIETGLIATQQNDTYNWQLYDNGPYSTGSTFDILLAGSQAGSLAARNIWTVNNTNSESFYTTGGGRHSLDGYMLEYTGPIGNGFLFTNPIHGSFLTEHNCGFGLVNTTASAGYGISQLCASSVGVTHNLGWNIEGDTYLTSSANGLLTSAVASFTDAGIAFGRNATMTGNASNPTLTLNPTSGLGTYDTLVVNGTSTFNGNMSLASGQFTGDIVSASIDMPAYTNCVASFSSVGGLQCNTGAITGSSLEVTQVNLNNGTPGQLTGRFLSNLGAVGFEAFNNGIGTGYLTLTGDSQVIIHANTSAGTAFTDGNIFGGYSPPGPSPGLWIHSSNNTFGTNSANAGSLNLLVSDTGATSFQTVFSALDNYTAGALAGATLNPNGGRTTFGGPAAPKKYVVGILPNGSSNPVPVAGDEAMVTDATAFTPGSAPTGGGSTFAPVFYTGTGWVMY